MSLHRTTAVMLLCQRMCGVALYGAYIQFAYHPTLFLITSPTNPTKVDSSRSKGKGAGTPILLHIYTWPVKK